MFKRIKTLFEKPSHNIKPMIDEGAVIVDVRTAFEFRIGHLPGSRNIPLDTLSSKIEELKKLNKKVITVCRSGSRSATAKNMLVAAGIDACNGGAWQNLKEAV
jgi:rhodanese-related sulfurtransferase